MMDDPYKHWTKLIAEAQKDIRLAEMDGKVPVYEMFIARGKPAVFSRKMVTVTLITEDDTGCRADPHVVALNVAHA
jgi:hypothetical protein